MQKRKSTKKSKPETVIYTEEEVKNLLTALRKNAMSDPTMFHHYIYALLATFNGMRRGEIYGLEWSDIDFENKTISIKRQRCYRPKIGLYTDTPKTTKSIRTIGLSDYVLEQLQTYKELHPQNELYADKDGNQYHPNLSYSYLKNFCNKHGLKFEKPHAMRHFCATMCISSGKDISAVSSFLGHSDITTTLNIYTHQHNQLEKTREIASAMEKILNLETPK